MKHPVSVLQQSCMTPDFPINHYMTLAKPSSSTAVNAQWWIFHIVCSIFVLTFKTCQKYHVIIISEYKLLSVFCDNHHPMKFFKWMNFVFRGQFRLWKNLKSYLHSEYFSDSKDDSEIQYLSTWSKCFIFVFLLMNKMYYSQKK